MKKPAYRPCILRQPCCKVAEAAEGGGHIEERGVALAACTARHAVAARLQLLRGVPSRQHLSRPVEMRMKTVRAWCRVKFRAYGLITRAGHMVKL